MGTRTLQVVIIVLSFATLAAAPQNRTRTASRASAQPRQSTAPKRRAPSASRPDTLPCGDYSTFQVLLDRQGFSPGQIDGQPGDNFAHALTAFQTANDLPTSGPDCATWDALIGESDDETLVAYTIT